MNKRFTGIIPVLLSILTPAILFACIKPKRQPEQVHETQITTTAYVSEEIYINLLHEDGVVERLPLEKYICGVVLREMPSDFEVEALKAQAIVARTYALRRADGNPKHLEAAVCVDSSCCQGYCSQSDYMLEGGSESGLEKVTSAVYSTAGMVVVYNGELIEATYFSCSGGMTEDASAVWGADIPYLQATASPGEQNATHYTDTVSISIEDFMFRLGLYGYKELEIENVEYTDGYGVASVSICGESYSGTQLRGLFGLNSTRFDICVSGNQVVISTQGFGHRVGMSQYGADAMAVQGADCKQILQHYYQGVNLVQYADVH